MIPVLVTGATGHQGGAVARALLGRGHRVRVLTRRPESAEALALQALGAEPAVGDFDDRASLEEAARGQEAIFAMGTPYEVGPETETRQAKALADIAKTRGVVHFLYSSVSGSNRKTGIPHFESKFAVEQHIKAIGLPHTILRPVSFMENLLRNRTTSQIPDGKLAMAHPGTRKLQQVALRNLAEFACLVFERRGEFLGKEIDIASDELTGNEAAKALSGVLGVRIEYVEIPIESLRKRSEDLAKMNEWMNKAGYDVDIKALHRAYPEVGWLTFAAWAERQDWSSLMPKATGGQKVEPR